MLLIWDFTQNSFHRISISILIFLDFSTDRFDIGKKPLHMPVDAAQPPSNPAALSNIQILTIATNKLGAFAFEKQPQSDVYGNGRF